MRVNELMIGDWVEMPKEYHCGKVYETDNYSAAVSYGNKNNGVRCKLSDLEPIPLTAEILEKNGFTTHLSHCGIKWLWIEKQKFELAIDEENRNKITTALGLIDIEIKNVHELQHALRLCGIDKEIEL